MKLKFRHKVFLSFLFNSIVVVISMLLIGEYYASRNFEEYIGKVETERLKKLVTALSQKYQKSGNWDLILNDWDHWIQWTALGPGKKAGDAADSGSPFPPPPRPPKGPFPEVGGPSPGQPFPPRLGPPHVPGEIPPIALFDSEKRPMTLSENASSESYRLEPIRVDGQLVGWLGLKRFRGPSHPVDAEFVKHQSQMFYFIGGIALILALIVTFGLSSHLLAPVKELAQGVRALSSRRFETRIEVPQRDELGQLALDFNAMAKTLERYEQMRQQWIADISHELKTPLAILRGEIEAMLDGIMELSPQALESLHFEVMHLGRIVHDLHDLSRIESRTSDVEQTAVNPLAVLNESLKSFQTRLENCGIRVEIKDVNGESRANPVEILADSDRLKQLFSNLLENTLRYVQSPGVLKISHEILSGRLFLYFEDSGPGVPAESLDRLFDRLYRVDKARSRAHGGSGLGLAICKSIVERFEGRIEACNGSSGGLRITLDFPVLDG